MNRRGISHSNLGRRLTHGQWHALLLSRSGTTETEHRKAPWPMAWASWSSSYSAWNDARFLPMRSRLWEELILQTYRGENGPREVGDGEVAQAVFNGSGDDVWRFSGSMDSSDSDGVVRGSSSKWWIGTGVSGVAARRQCCGSAMAARVRQNSHGIGHYL
jgi:hypothetical protein